MQRAKLDSQAVLSAGYDPDTLTLEIEFSSGRVYQYDEVPESVYNWLLRTPSKGTFISRMINGRYAYRDVSQHVQLEVLPLEEALRASLAQLEHKV